MTVAPKGKIREATPAPIARFESGVGVIGGCMYVVGGHLEPELSATAAMYRYDPSDDSWTRLADAPQEISHVTATVVGDRHLWLAGGYVGQHPGTGIAESYRYDVSRDVWEEGPPLPAIRASGGLACIDGRLHYFGGLDADRSTNRDDHWILDPAAGEGWETARPMPMARTHAATAIHGGGIYAIGGHYGHDVPGRPGVIDPQADLDAVHRYDPISDSWEERRPLPHRRSHCEPGTFVHEGRIYCAGGRSIGSFGELLREDRPLSTRVRRIVLKAARKLKRGASGAGVDDLLCYDPSSDRWASVMNLGRGLYAPAAVCIEGEMILTNGGGRGWQDPSDRTIRIHL